LTHLTIVECFIRSNDQGQF